MSNDPKTRFDVNMTSGLEMSHGISEYYQTPADKKAQAEFEYRYGHPTDIDKVWEDRNKAYHP